MTDRRGMALALAIVAMVIVGGLVAGAFLVGRVEHSLGRNTWYAVEAGAAAEAGLAEILGNWPAYGPAAAPVGTTVTLPSTPLGGTSGRSSYTPAIRRLTPDLLLITSLGTRHDAAGGILAERTYGALARLVLMEDASTVLVPLAQRSWLQLY